MCPTVSDPVGPGQIPLEPAPPQASQLPNGPILRVSLSVDSRVSSIPRNNYHLVRLVIIAVCFSPKRRK